MYQAYKCETQVTSQRLQMKTRNENEFFTHLESQWMINNSESEMETPKALNEGTNYVKNIEVYVPNIEKIKYMKNYK